MQSVEAFKKLLLKVNKNDTNTDIDISKGEFVLMFNEQKDRWLIEKIEVYRNNKNIQDLFEMQVKHFSIPKILDTNDYTTFQLPTNYCSYVSSYSYCSSLDGKCKDILVRNFEFKPSNENMLLENTNFQPSLEYEETIVDLSENQLFVYRKDFNVDKVFLNYYKLVDSIDLAGYIKLDGTPSQNLDSELSDIYMEQIIDRCVLEVIRRYENPDGFQLAQNRLQMEG